jgi:splicing factor 1
MKKTRKVYIPVKEYPEYNFIGLIIGPRGNMQKRMERASGAKIAIRGKGAAKEGKANKVQYFDDDELHVLITGDSDEQISKAEQLVKQLLVPIAEERNEIKKDQLRELAKINGTLREGSWNVERSFDQANVKCDICGEVSHPTKDCPQAKNGEGGVVLPKTIDDEYESFLVEIGEKKKDEGNPGAPPPPGGAGALNSLDDSYNEFMEAIGDGMIPLPPFPLFSHSHNRN